MTLEDLRVFATVAAERSFSRAARKLRRTQPAVSQAIRRLEESSGERLVDRSSRDGTLTDAGRVLLGANEGGVHGILPLIAAFQKEYPAILVDVRRVHARQMAQEVLLRTVDFGVLTFNPSERELLSLLL